MLQEKLTQFKHNLSGLGLFALWNTKVTILVYTIWWIHSLHVTQPDKSMFKLGRNDTNNEIYLQTTECTTYSIKHTSN